MQGKSNALFQRFVPQSSIDCADEFDLWDENENDIEDVLNGYIECMTEAVRYLMEIERFPSDHPTVQAMKQHLTRCKEWLLSDCQGFCDL